MDIGLYRHGHNWTEYGKQYNIMQHHILILLIASDSNIGLYRHGHNWIKYEKRIWTSDPKQDTRPGQNTVSTVVPFCTFLRIENRVKTKRHVFYSRK